MPDVMKNGMWNRAKFVRGPGVLAKGRWTTFRAVERECGITCSTNIRVSKLCWGRKKNWDRLPERSVPVLRAEHFTSAASPRRYRTPVHRLTKMGFRRVFPRFPGKSDWFGRVRSRLLEDHNDGYAWAGIQAAAPLPTIQPGRWSAPGWRHFGFQERQAAGGWETP